jgi:hypothetical protein
VLDDYKRKGLRIEVDISLPAPQVAWVLHELVATRRRPDSRPLDNRPELIG